MGARWPLGNYFTVHVSDDGGLDQGETSGGSEKWSHSGRILNGEPMKWLRISYEV